MREPGSLLPASWPHTAHRTKRREAEPPVPAEDGDRWLEPSGSTGRGLQSLSQRFDQEPATKPVQNRRQGSVLTLPLKEGEGSCAAEQLPTLPKHLPQHPPPSRTSPISLLGSQSYSRAGPRSARCDRHFKACTGTYFKALCASCSAALGRSSDSFLPSPRKAQ